MCDINGTWNMNRCSFCRHFRFVITGTRKDMGIPYSDGTCICVKHKSIMNEPLNLLDAGVDVATIPDWCNEFRQPKIYEDWGREHR